MCINKKYQEVSPARLRVVAFTLTFAWSVSSSAAAAEAAIVGVDGSRFTLNVKPTFLLGVSYYGALGHHENVPAGQRFFRGRGGFASIGITRIGDAPQLTTRFHDSRGVVVHEWKTGPS
jgi:hypothetical protein